MIPSQSQHKLISIRHHQRIHTCHLQCSYSVCGCAYKILNPVWATQTCWGIHMPVCLSEMVHCNLTSVLLIFLGNQLFSCWQQPGRLLSIPARPGESDVFPPWSGQQLLQSSIITCQHISSRNTSHPPLTFSYIPHTAAVCSVNSENASFPLFLLWSLTHFSPKLDL